MRAVDKIVEMMNGFLPEILGRLSLEYDLNYKSFSVQQSHLTDGVILNAGGQLFPIFIREEILDGCLSPALLYERMYHILRCNFPRRNRDRTDDVQYSLSELEEADNFIKSIT